MITAQHRKVPARIRIRALFDVLDPRAIYPDGNIVFFLAGNGARVTADAAVLIDNKSVAHNS
jgi:hypothetical protein